MDGLSRCTRYAFGPNRLHYCGPDKAGEIAAYLENNTEDAGLKTLLSQFQTMYPYLQQIAHSNHIKDPFDERVVEAYWLGNDLLEHVTKRELHRHLIDNLLIPKRIGAKSFRTVEEKISQGAVPHHSFHVFDIWKRTGHLDREHTVESMDSCRISWGKIMETDGPFLTVETEPLIYAEGKLVLGTPVVKKITRGLEAEVDIDEAKAGDIVSIHWDIPCEIITPQQAATLKSYTLKHLALANETL